MPLSRSRFLEFAVALPEKGDLAGMRRMLDEEPRHRDELLFGARVGGDGGRYSALGYATWLCQFGEWEERARPIVRWLLDEGAERDVWVDVALRDRAAFRDRLERAPELVDARHPVWQSPILELVPADWRQDLVDAGADVSDPFSAILVGDLERVRALVAEDAESVFRLENGVGFSVLDHAITQRRDELACWLIDRGAPTPPGTPRKLGPLVLSCCWGCVATLAKLAGLGADLTVRVAGRSLLSYAANAAVPSPELVRFLVERGLDPTAERFEGRALAEHARARGYPDLAGALEGPPGE